MPMNRQRSRRINHRPLARYPLPLLNRNLLTRELVPSHGKPRAVARLRANPLADPRAVEAPRRDPPSVPRGEMAAPHRALRSVRRGGVVAPPA